ncbi:HNH endonuclease [Enterovibrio coralii]|uniref:HNH endonuclease n=1 Tax=Enterovibrio coralii TaxID=294935 RepID=A0A135I2S2_9GAMM|nr:HNH endonuclease [Enterovibrio coralii]KXF79728.1 HNH endonuclease [Enterovibrio coralii]
MAVYNTSSDSANTAVRAFLTKVGEFYFGASFNTASGKGKAVWAKIKEQDFNGCCAYCGDSSSTLQVEHHLMFNRTEYGLHHPGNVVPCCKGCNKRTRKADKSFSNWEEHLLAVCYQKGQADKFESRKIIIQAHIKNFHYPELTASEKHAIRVIANSLYDNIKIESDKSLGLYKELDKAFNKEI